LSRLRTAAATDVGYLRATNQDVALATDDLAAVADGMGGHLGGEVAARIAVEQLLEAHRSDRTTDGLVAAVRAANSAVYRRSRSDRSLRGMGTTLTAAAFVADEPNGQARLALVNVGDSRAYLVDRPERVIHKLTKDHSVVEEMVRSGELSPDEAAVHPHRHILTRALGIEPRIEPDCWELQLAAGSRVLICSDGLTNELDEQEIADVLLGEPDGEKAAAELVDQALRHGGSDNVTVVVLDVLGEGGSVMAGDDVVVIPAVITGAPGPATGQGSPTAPMALAGIDSSQVTPAQEAPRAAHTRPVVLVPRAKRLRSQRDRIVTIRVALFVLVFVAILGGASGVVLWFDKASFYVGLDHGYVTIFQGRPGGLLWFQPSVVERTTLTPADLLASNVAYLKQGMEQSSYQAARNVVHALSLEHSLVARSAPVTTTTVPVLAPATATTVAGVATTSTATTTTVAARTTTSTTATTAAASTTTTTIDVPITTTTGAK
jgi:protein phosphatase